MSDRSIKIAKLVKWSRTRQIGLRPNVEGLETRALLSLAGALDPAFGTGGSVTVNLVAMPGIPPNSEVDDVVSVAVQPDGKTVVAGDRTTTVATPGLIGPEYPVVTRLDPGGSVDTTFGAAGFVTPFPGDSSGSSFVTAILVQPDGKIVVAGGSGTRDLITRLNPDGSVDTTFGDGGTFTFVDPTINLGDISRLALAPNGQILFEAVVNDASGDASTDLVARLNANGTLDTTFGTGGIANAAVAFGEMTVGADGKIILTGEFGTKQVEQLDADGSPDTSFGMGGVVDLPLDAAVGTVGSENFYNVAVQPDGKILVAGTAIVKTGPASSPASVDSAQAIVARLNLDGSLDTSFGGTGEVLVGKPSSNFPDPALAVQPDGKVVVGGLGLAVARLNPDGSPDEGFGVGGVSAGQPQEDGVLPAVVFVLPDGNVEAAVGGTITQFFGQTVTGDYDNDGKADPAVYIPSQGVFAYRPSSGGADVVIPFGFAGAGQTLPAPGDYDGTGTTELAAYLPSLGEFAIRPSDGSPDRIIPFGIAGAGQTIPAPGDYDGSGKTEIAAYLPSLGIFVYRPADGGADVTIPFGFAGPGQTIPAPGDYDGDGKTDIAAYLPSLGEFAIRPSSGGPDEIIPFGIAGAGQSIPVPGDYDGSGKTEIAVYIPSLATLFYRPADGGPDVAIPFGFAGAGQTLPAPGDYDGSGKTEVAAYLPSLGIFAYRPADGGADVITPFGIPGQTIPFNTIDTAPPAPPVSGESIDVLPGLAAKKDRSNQVSQTVET